MEISAIGIDQFSRKLQISKTYSVQTSDFGIVKSDSKENSAAKTTQNTADINTIFEKLRNQSAKVQNKINGHNSSFISQSKGALEQVDNERYTIKESEDIEGYWEIYDKDLNKHITFNPNASNIQYSEKSGKNYLIAEEPGYGYCFAEEMPDELMDSIEEFMNVDEIKANPLESKYIIKTDPTTGIDSFTLSGQEGGVASIMISSEEQMDKLQKLADIYANDYPNLVTSNDMALSFATSEILGTCTRTTNGILITCQTGMEYMDETNSDRDWGVTFDQSEDTYKKISQAIQNGMIDDIETYDLWKDWFDDNGINHEKNITDEVLAELLLQDKEKNYESEEIYEKLSVASSGIQDRILKTSAVEEMSADEEIKGNDLKNIGLTSFEISDTTSQLVLASLVKSSDGDDPIVQVSYGRGDARKVYQVHVNEVDTTNASDLEMFALLSYEGYKGKTMSGTINNYSAYKSMKANAGYEIGTKSEDTFVNEKIDAEKLLQEVYDQMKDGKSAGEKKNADICDYLLELLKNRSDLSGER